MLNQYHKHYCLTLTKDESSNIICNVKLCFSDNTTYQIIIIPKHIDYNNTNILCDYVCRKLNLIHDSSVSFSIIDKTKIVDKGGLQSSIEHLVDSAKNINNTKQSFEQSKNWDMCISANELLSKYEEVYFDFKYHSHSSDEGYGQFAIYAQIEPNRSYCIINIDEDGLVYNGNTDRPEKGLKHISKIKTKDAYEILLRYRQLVKSAECLENALRPYSNDDCVNIIINSDYIIERMNK